MKEFMELFGFWGTLLGLIVGTVGMYFSWNAWNESRQTKKLVENEKKRLNEKVGIVLTDGTNEYHLPKLRRQDVVRSEIQGRLGVIPIKKKGERYTIEFTNSPEFFSQIDLVSEGANETGETGLKIFCTKEEFAQFGFDQPKLEAKRENAEIKKIAEIKELKNKK